MLMKPENESSKQVKNSAARRGDRISTVPKAIEDKSQQTVIDSWNLTERTLLTTYFLVKTTNGEKKLLYRVKDVEKIPDTICQLRVAANDNLVWF